MKFFKLCWDGTTRRWMFTTGAANSKPENCANQGQYELLGEQRLHGQALNRSKDVAKRENRRYQTQHRVAVASQPVQVALRSGFPHEEHDARAAVERRNRQKIKRSQQQIEEEENAKDARGDVRAAGGSADPQPLVRPAEAQDQRRDQHQRVTRRRAGQRHPRRPAGMPPRPLGIVWRAGPAEQVASHDQREDRNHYHAPRFALDVRNGIERNLSTGERRIIPVDFVDPRVRGFEASGGEKNRDIPDKTQRDKFGLEISHEATLRLLRLSRVDGPAPLCKQDARWVQRPDRTAELTIGGFIFSSQKEVGGTESVWQLRVMARNCVRPNTCWQYVVVATLK